MQTLLLTRNECYIVGRKITPRGIMVHSTGANNPNLRRYVGPDDGILGHNPNGNHWNIFHPGGRDIGPHPFKRDPQTGRCATCGGRQVCVHAFIGLDRHGKARVYQTLPWDARGWHAGHTAGNDTHIGFEICEDDLRNPQYFATVYGLAVDMCAYLCKQYNLSPNTIIGHFEGHRQGIASNHADPGHWFPRHGKSMDTFRADVAEKLKGADEVIPNRPGENFLLYQVQRGDSLSRIGTRFGTTAQNLGQWNGIADLNRIEIGQLVWVPIPQGDNTALQAELQAAKNQNVLLEGQISKINTENKTIKDALARYRAWFGQLNTFLKEV